MRIIIYGHSKREFPNGWPDFEDYLRNELAEHGRYRHTQNKNADRILISIEGFLRAELWIKKKEKPTADEAADFEQVYGKKPRSVYIVSEIRIIKNQKGVSLEELGIANIQYGKSVDQNTYARIVDLSQGFELLES
ncbi:MAG: hypothetical protein ACFFD4_23045 [Candidatus Odinarchaeota archaeon]